MAFLIISILIISVIGTLSHFLYDITSHNKIVGLFCAVNESTWEHIKIALMPTIFWSLLDGMIYGINPNYFLAKFVSLAVIIFLMPLLFYGYKLISKKDKLFLDILIFYITIIASQLIFFFILKATAIAFVWKYLSCLGLFVIFGGYLLLTLLPLENFIFKDPISKRYGFDGHTEMFSKKNNDKKEKE